MYKKSTNSRGDDKMGQLSIGTFVNWEKYFQVPP